MKGKKQKSLIKKVIVIVFVLMLVSFVSMNVITIEFFKAKMLAVQGINQTMVQQIISSSVGILTVMAVGVSILLMVVLALCIYYMIVKPVNTLGQNIKRMSEFDLTADATGSIDKFCKRTDEIGTLSNGYEAMRSNMVALLGNINEVSHSLSGSADSLSESSTNVSSMATELSVTMDDLANGATAQADEIAEGDRQIISVSQMIQMLQENMEVMGHATQEMDALRQSSLEALQNVVEDSHKNKDSSRKVHEVIGETSQQTRNIQAASAQIREIADETNMLALNASIEAARAGEAGKGFAVVASEIGNLASATNELTGKIETIIEDLVAKMDMTVEMIENMEQAIDKEASSVEETEDQFGRIASHLQKLQDICNGLVKSASQMEDKRTSIVSMIETLSAISQENAASMEEVAAAVEEQTKSIENVSASSSRVAEDAEQLTIQIDKFVV